LQKEQRGCALVIFHHDVRDVIILDKESNASIFNIMMALLNRDSGGTNFNYPYLTSFGIKDRLKWKALSTVFITDGVGSLSPAVYAYIKSRRKLEDRLNLVLVNRATTNGFQGLENWKAKLTRENMQLKLTELGNSLL